VPTGHCIARYLAQRLMMQPQPQSCLSHLTVTSAEGKDFPTRQCYPVGVQSASEALQRKISSPKANAVTTATVMSRPPHGGPSPRERTPTVVTQDQSRFQLGCHARCFSTSALFISQWFRMRSTRWCAARCLLQLQVLSRHFPINRIMWPLVCS
jgi:hypothetical protein